MPTLKLNYLSTLPLVEFPTFYHPSYRSEYTHKQSLQKILGLALSNLFKQPRANVLQPRGQLRPSKLHHSLLYFLPPPRRCAHRYLRRLFPSGS